VLDGIDERITQTGPCLVVLVGGLVNFRRGLAKDSQLSFSRHGVHDAGRFALELLRW
jgi:hypothetical protein